MNTKRKFFVTLCWHGENHEFYNYASDETRSLNKAIYKLTTILKKDITYVRSHFKTGDRYTVKEVIPDA